MAMLACARIGVFASLILISLSPLSFFFVNPLSPLSICMNHFLCLSFPLLLCIFSAFSLLHFIVLGAIHSVVFGGFAAPELAVRINDATPKVSLTVHMEPLFGLWICL